MRPPRRPAHPRRGDVGHGPDRNPFRLRTGGGAPDLVVVAKGLGAGYQPIGAVLASEAVYRGIGAGGGYFRHGHTYMGHAAACAAAAVLAGGAFMAAETPVAEAQQILAQTTTNTAWMLPGKVYAFGIRRV